MQPKMAEAALASLYRPLVSALGLPRKDKSLAIGPEPPELAGFYVDSHCDAAELVNCRNSAVEFFDRPARERARIPDLAPQRVSPICRHVAA